MQETSLGIIEKSTAALLANWLKYNHQMCSKHDVTWEEAIGHTRLLKQEIRNLMMLQER